MRVQSQHNQPKSKKHYKKPKRRYERETMSADLYDIVKHNPKFAQLVSRRARWAWGLSSIVLLIYFVFILLIAFTPHWLAQPIASGSVITIGIPLGLLVIIVAFVLTGIYVHKANTDFDRINQDIIRETQQ